MRTILHVVYNRDTEKWNIKKASSGAVLASYVVKPEAVDNAINLAKCFGLSQIKIHGLDGKIQSERTYGKDPRRYIG